MSDLLRKLNTLINANIHDALGNTTRRDRPPTSFSTGSPELDRQIADLRGRINSALEHEDELLANVKTLQNEVERLDLQADDAIMQGRNDEAKRILEQMKRAQQRLEMAEADLRAHQAAAEDLIRRVNLLEATVADNKAAAQPTEPQPPPVNDDSKISRISEVLRDTRDKIVNRMDDLVNAQTNTQTEAAPQSPLAAPETPAAPKTKDDLDERINRLSKK